MKQTGSKNPHRQFDGRKYLLSVFAFFWAALVFAQPRINGFTPASGPAGAVVTINGANFSATPANNIVFFGGIQASVSTATATALSVSVPASADYGLISVTTGGLSAYSSKPFVLTFPGGGTFTQNAFAKKIDSATEGSPYSVIMGDIDGDGKMDLVEVNGGYPYSVSVFRNTSTGGVISFAPKVDFATGIVPFDLALTDLDGDGKQDLVIANSGFGSNTISLLKNTSSPGSISFSQMGQFQTGTDPISVATGDLDGDGKPDIAVANFSNNTVSVFRNTTNGGIFSLDTKMDYAVGNLPSKILIGDIDGDGKPEMMVSNSSSNNISLFRNVSTVGSIGFTPAITIPTGITPQGIALGDLDGDGKSELVVANAGTGTVSVLHNTSIPAAISFDPKIDLSDTTGPIALAISDLDGDGKPDLISLNQASATVSIFRNTSSTGSISFDTHLDFKSGQTPYNIIAGDLDGDAKPELVTCNMQDNTLSIFKNTINGTRINDFSPKFGGDSTIVLITGNNFTGATAVYFGGTSALSFTVLSDTAIRVFVGTGSTGNVTIVAPKGTATLSSFLYYVRPSISSFSPTSAGSGTNIMIVGANFTGATVVSFGGVAADSFRVISDTQISAWTAYGASGAVSITTPGGTISQIGFVYSSTPPSINSFTPGFGPVGTSVTIQGAGFNPNPSADKVYFGPVQATVQSATSNVLVVSVPPGSAFQPITVTANHLTAYSDHPFDVSFSDTASAFNANSFGGELDIPVGVSPEGICAGDLDGDGRSDLIVANNGNTAGVGHCISVLQNTSSVGHLSFAPEVNYYGSTSTWFTGVATGDFNGDGKLDIAALANGDGAVYLYLNTSSNGVLSLAPPILFTVGYGPFSIAVRDLDGDGRPDIVVANTYWNSLSVLMNTSSNDSLSFAPQLLLGTGADPEGLSIGDLDGDGKPDLAVANDGEPTHAVYVFKNTGSIGNISFSPPIIYSTTTNSYSNSTFIGDVSGDNKPELLVANYNTSNASILSNLSSPGNISLGAPISYSYAKQYIRLADMDGDGKPDMLETNGPGVSLWKNIGSSGSIAFDTVNYYLNGTGSSCHLETDLDGDGKPDLAVVNVNAGTISILRNQIGSGPSPTINYFTPDTALMGTQVTVVGAHLSNATVVSFGGVPASSFSVVSDSVLIATVASGATGNLLVSTLAGFAQDSGFVFRGPVINNFSPSIAATKTIVTITGSSLSGASSVSFSGIPAMSFTVVSDSVISAVVGKGASGNITITTSLGTATVAGFIYSKAPVILSFSPSSAQPGATVTIQGVNFIGTSAVSFGGAPASSYLVVSDSVVTAVVGSGASGTVNVFTPIAFDFLAGFIFINSSQPPVIQSFTPTYGTAGTVITITGSHLSGTTSVLIGDSSSASFQVLSDSVIQVVVGAGTSGSITVITPSGTTSVPGFSFNTSVVPLIYSFAPAAAGEGASVLIVGKNFTGISTVSFGGTNALSFTILSDSTIAAIVGSGSTGNIIVSGSAGGATAAGFTYTGAVVPDSSFQLVQFSGAITSNGISLSWTTVNEQHISNYIIERGSDSTSLSPISSVISNGDSLMDFYSFLDVSPGTGSNYYQLKMINSFGPPVLSQIINVTMPTGLKLYPNPANSYVDVLHPVLSSTSQIQVMDFTGHIVLTSPVAANTSLTRIELGGTPNGIYKIVWIYGNNKMSKSLVIQN